MISLQIFSPFFKPHVFLYFKSNMRIQSKLPNLLICYKPNVLTDPIVLQSITEMIKCTNLSFSKQNKRNCANIFTI